MLVSIPNGKGKAKKAEAEKKAEEVVSIPNGKGKDFFGKMQELGIKRINSQWER